MRATLSRLLLLALLVLGVVVAVRSGAEAADGVVSLAGVGVDRLEHQAFRVSGPAVLAVDAAGSFEEAGSPTSDTTLAATAWIVRRADGAVVWQMRPPRPARGTFAAVQDTVRLPAGLYDAYVASYGDPLVRAPAPPSPSLGERLRTALNRSGRAWRGDAGRWRLVVRAVGAGGAVERVSGDPADDALDRGGADSAVVWRAWGVGSGERRESLFRVTAPARVRVRALVEATDGVLADSAFVVRLGTRDTVWAARPERTAWAGGSLKNRLATGELALAPGYYRAVYLSDRDHAYDSWTSNPPWAPWQWGMEVQGGAAVAPLDVDDVDLPEVAAIRCAGPDDGSTLVFTLDAPADVLVVTVGEVVGGSRYDWGALDREAPGGGWNEVWEMPRSDLEPAGGADRNRQATAALSLDTGTYRLRYETDASHDCQSGFRGEGGPRAELWGVVLYALDPAFDPALVGRPAPPPEVETVLAEAIAGEGGAEQAVPFTLEVDAALAVAGAGVFMSDVLVETGWIVDEDGRRVWEMTRDNTDPVGGSPVFRQFRGVVDLPAGAYVLHHQADATGAAGALAGAVDPDVQRGVRVVRAR
ncbi:hypothetical protein RQM47_14440 [Rubrivirga sp. S365]|uniref:hypothetical protein n=1 Tax=Rubrivirga sp. S365 TaxID=3076080 RepID=UPI0028C65E3F|nr:hypothetical protein [Rubrivirga sp. S365]MDT7857846.1 hypothetical protein [Rubrivirga sp. S365]